MRSAIGVIVGYAVWTAIWLGGNAVLLPEAAEVVQNGEPYTETGPLAMAIGLSVVCSLLGGLVAALIARAKGRGPAVVLAVLLLATGVFVQLGVWDLMPVWYHATFLALLVPMTLAGAGLVRAKGA